MTITFLFAVLVSLFGQTSIHNDKSACEQRAQNVMRSLEPGNSLRHALENGERGDCIHQPWMDTMRRFGIKQASFLLEYSWKREKVTFRVKKISYLTRYYSQYDRAITGRTLREIKKSGLERELIEVVLANVKKGPFAVRHADQVAKDVWEENLLDDEALTRAGRDLLKRRNPTTCWTGAALACFASNRVRRGLNEIAPPRQLPRSTANSEANCA